MAARECRVSAQIAKAISTNGIIGTNSAATTLKAAKRRAPATISITNGSISRPKTSLTTSRRMMNGRRKGKKRRQKMPLLTGACLHEFRRM